MLGPVRTYSLCTVLALDLMTGETVPFMVEHEGTAVQAIRYGDGIRVPLCSEQFTETEAAFLLDYEKLLKEAEASDVPHLRRYYL